MRKNDLKGFARRDGSLRLVDGSQKFLFRKVGRERSRFGLIGHGIEVDGGPLHQIDDRVESLARLFEKLPGGLGAFRKQAGDDQQLLSQMIEHHDIVKEQELRIGHPEGIGIRVGQSFAPSGHAVAEKSDRSPGERGK